ncbi:MAG TPA: hypothetical protein VLX58_20360 [Bryobacteraceae bacterium]|nr:hypothetical protein [Bryobacteraceae bacterium]
MKSNRARRGGVLAGVLAAFLILAALAVVGAFLAGMYLADNIHVEKRRGANGETVKVETPIGSMRVQEHRRLDPKLIGVPVYPGATREDDQGKAASVDFSIDSAHKEFTLLAAAYSTSDSFDRVKEFYHRELPHWIISQRSHGSLHMEYSEDGFKRIVAITERDGRTRIALASVGEAAAN